MCEPHQVRTFHSPQIFSSINKIPSTSMKLMTLLHTLISSQICRAIRALSRAKSFLIEVVRKGQPVRLIYRGRHAKKGNAYFRSFRLHYNWCSSRSFSVPNSVLDGLRPNYLQYDATTWNVAEVAEEEDDGSSQLSGYLRWLEERRSEDSGNKDANGEKLSSGGVNEIDELADVFIAKFHEKFILEKQESDRRFQEMLARSM